MARFLTVGNVQWLGHRAASNGLLNNLIAYWKLDEASGNALDAHTNALTLTDNNTVTSGTGKVYATARQFTRANVEYLSRASQALLQTGGTVDFSFVVWVNLTSLETPQALISKRDASGSGEFVLFYGSSTYFEWFVYDGAFRNINSNTFGSPSTGAWYMVYVEHRSSTKTIGISVNNGALDTYTYAGTFSADASKFLIGAERSGIGISASNALIGPVAFWKSAPGGGGALDAAARTALWNNGNGLQYSAFTA